MTPSPEDRPPEAPMGGGAGAVGQPSTGPGTPGPYAGPPGTPTAPYDLDAGPHNHQNVLIAVVLGIIGTIFLGPTVIVVMGFVVFGFAAVQRDGG